ncbi:hypothetical protein SETIT_5G034800v2 [Setaria italica]|uniref:Uncharacterized protein n=1 Tax=Setaria italica TaxID=4555 RepID=A0A368R0U1_SETIT|nr:bromodomain adjacent to zinc finger domain protein 2B-like [Setaria italica]RCV23816.1 hypothetical protein SETIT_5G034800v2 [Setaria italica]
MASPLTETSPPPTLRDVIGHDDDDDNFIAEEEEEEDEDEEDEWDMSKRLSRLSMEGSDGGDADDEDGGDGEDEEEEADDDDEFEVRSDINGATYGGGAHHPWPPYDGLQAAPSSASLPGTPDRGAQAAGARSSPPWWPGPSGGNKEYASETEARWPPEGGRGGRRPWQRRERMAREVWLERAWRMRKQRRQLQEAAVPVVVLGGGGGSPASFRGGGVAMDMEEVRACRDLGLDLPCDWTVEIPSHALSGVDTASSGGNSPASGSWRISSPGDDPKDVKARLKVWAQAVALASASRLGS